MDTIIWYINLIRVIVMNFLAAIEITRQLINDIIFLCETRTKPTYFTRSNSKMDFQSLILFQLNFVKKSIQIELDEFFHRIQGSDMGITKQAFSEARKKISPLAFIQLANAIICWFYAKNDFKTFKGYRLCAIDGSFLEINNSKRLREAFGYIDNGNVKIARALAAGIYEIENDMMITAKITQYTTGERELAMQLIELLKGLGLKRDLILFDRGYPSKAFIAYLEKNNINYLMRVKKGFLKAIEEAKHPDQIVEIQVDKKTIKVRVLRFVLNSGEEECLITNVIDESFTVQDFKELYFKRWGIEVKYDELKNRFQIENFTGDTKLAVEQDFYASIYLSNMVALAKQDANKEIAVKNEGKNFKYDYKVNANILIGKLKDSMVLMLLEDNKEKRSRLLNQIMREVSRNVIPIRPGRSNVRKMGLKSNKHPINQKRCL